MSWSQLPFFSSDLYREITRKTKGDDIFPPPTIRFRALELTAPEDTRVVILGQDPYPTRGHATGLAFSVPSHVERLPPTLWNIFREYKSDTHYKQPTSGNLELWARRGVLLLNTALSVKEGKPGSHLGIGWQKLTEEILENLSQKNRKIAFILWGNYAQKFRSFIKRPEYVISSPHPSPLSASRGFFGSRPFTRANEILKKEAYIDWRLP